jgi:hypothetical protein
MDYVELLLFQPSPDALLQPWGETVDSLQGKPWLRESLYTVPERPHRGYRYGLHTLTPFCKSVSVFLLLG